MQHRTYHVNNGKLTHKVKNGCDTTSLEIKDNSKNHSVVCSRSSHSCMSGAYAGDPPTIIAFGCVPTSKVMTHRKLSRRSVPQTRSVTTQTTTGRHKVATKSATQINAIHATLPRVLPLPSSSVFCVWLPPC